MRPFVNAGDKTTARRLETEECVFKILGKNDLVVKGSVVCCGVES